MKCLFLNLLYQSLDSIVLPKNQTSLWISAVHIGGILISICIRTILDDKYIYI